MSDSYEKGNVCFKRGDFCGAVDCYSDALQQAKENVPSLCTKLYLNRAQCYLKLREYEYVVKDCSQVIALVSVDHLSLIKAYIRRATAFEYLGEFTKALTDTQTALALELPASLLHTLHEMMPRLNRLVACDDAVSNKEGCPKMLVTKHQTLRLVFMHPPPNELNINEAFSVKMCIGNELGLWNRALMDNTSNVSENHTTPVQLHCELIIIPTIKHTNDSDENIQIAENKLNMCYASGANASQPVGLVNIGADGKVSLDLKILDNANRNVSSETNNSNNNNKDKDNSISTQLIVLKFSLNRALPCGIEVVSVLSLPIQLTHHRRCNVEKGVTNSSPSEQLENQRVITNILKLCQDQHAYCIRDILIGDHYIYALESPGFLGIGGKVWDSTYILLQYLNDMQSEYVRGRRIVELGSGTGLAGISLCSMSPQSVILTDMTDVTPLLHANITLNSVLVRDASLKTVLRDRYTAMAHNWGTDLTVTLDEKPVPAVVSEEGDCDGSSGVEKEAFLTQNTIIGTDSNATIDDRVTSTTQQSKQQQQQQQHSFHVLDCDVIIASDVVYDPCAYQPLIDTLFQLLTPHYRVSDVLKTQLIHPVCILAHRHRHPDDQLFFNMLTANVNIDIQSIQYTSSTIGTSDSSSTDNEMHSKKSSDGCDQNSTLSDVLLFRIQYKM